MILWDLKFASKAQLRDKELHLNSLCTSKEKLLESIITNFLTDFSIGVSINVCT